MKKTIYKLYAVCAVLLALFFGYMCLNVGCTVESVRADDSYRMLGDVAHTQITDRDAVLGVRRVYEARLSGIPQGGNALVFHTVHQQVRVYLDGEQVYSLTKEPQRFAPRTPGCKWNSVPLYAQDNGKLLRVELTPVYKETLDVQCVFYIGARLAIWREIVKQGMLPFLFSSVAVICGVVLILFALCIRRSIGSNRALLMLGMFSSMLGIWKISDADTASLLVPNTAVLAGVPFLALLLLVVPFGMYIRELFFTKDSWLWDIPCIASIAVIAVTLVCQLLGLADMRETLWLNHAVMIFLMAVAFAMLFYEWRTKGWNSRLRVMLFGMGACLLGLAADIAVYYISGGGSMTVMGMLGFLTYIIVLGIMSVREARSLMTIGMQAKEFKNMAFHDQMTGLYNRTAYSHYTEDGVFSPDSSMVVMLDLNNLKHCNDTYGHEKGDIYITSSAKLIHKVFGTAGRCFRMGGDEFCVLMHKCAEDECLRMLSRLKEEVGLWNECHAEKFQIQIASGYARYDRTVDYNLGDTLRRADKMMYHEKFQMKQRSDCACRGAGGKNVENTKP